MAINIPGLNGILDKFDLMSIAKGAGAFFLFVVILIIVAGITGTILYLRKQKKLYSNTLHFFEEVNGQMVPVKDLKAAELTIPGTSLKVFHIKSEDLFIPRGTKKMGKKSYWYAIRNNRELVNFTMVNLNEAMREAKLDYDHTDMRYAFANLKELIKRNYRDKSTKWWQEYKDVISTVIFIFVMSVAFFFLLGKIGKLLTQVSELLELGNQYIEAMANLKSGSGVIGA